MLSKRRSSSVAIAEMSKVQVDVEVNSELYFRHVEYIPHSQLSNTNMSVEGYALMVEILVNYQRSDIRGRTLAV